MILGSSSLSLSQPSVKVGLCLSPFHAAITEHPILDNYNQQRFISSSARGWEVQDQGANIWQEFSCGVITYWKSKSTGEQKPKRPKSFLLQH